MTENKITEIQAFLNDPDHPFKQGEFKEFWQSLTDAEKDEFRKSDLKK